MSKELDDDCRDDQNPLSMLDPAGAPLRRRESNESDKDCQEGAKRVRVADAVVTQQEAKEWFDSPVARTLGRGAHGYVKALILDEKSPSAIGRAIAIKRWFVEGDETRQQFAVIKEIRQGVFRPRPEVLRDAQHEVAQHLWAWSELMNDAGCRQWIAQPAHMEWDQLPGDDGVYAVQELVYDKECARDNPANWSECRAATLMSVKDADTFASDGAKLWRRIGTTDAHNEQKKEFCRNYGRILACLARAKILHMDAHDENLLVFTNYTEDTAEALDEGGAKLQWAGIIDWGIAQRVQQGEGPRPGNLLCQKGLYEVGYRPRLRPSVCVAEENEEMGIADSFADLLWGGVSCQGKDEALCGTEGLVRQCIQEGFAGALELTIPEGIQKEVKREHLAEYRRRGGRQAAEPLSAAAVRAAIRDTGMPNLSNLGI